MIPETNTSAEFGTLTANLPSRTYGLHLAERQNYLDGYADGLEALKQAIFLRLNITKCQSPIYSPDYGVELQDLLGQPLNLVVSQLPARLNEALLADDRILGLSDFRFHNNRGALSVQFAVSSVWGSFEHLLELANGG